MLYNPTQKRFIELCLETDQIPFTPTWICSDESGLCLILLMALLREQELSTSLHSFRFINETGALLSVSLRTSPHKCVAVGQEVNHSHVAISLKPSSSLWVKMIHTVSQALDIIDIQYRQATSRNYTPKNGLVLLSFDRTMWKSADRSTPAMSGTLCICIRSKHLTCQHTNIDSTSFVHFLLSHPYWKINPFSEIR